MNEKLDDTLASTLGRAKGQLGTPNIRSFELGKFLRGRREELMPGDVGLPNTRRRRTPGLRREEVAELADISTSLYTWLEQGRDVAVSRRTIESVANALALSPPQRRHLFALADPQDVELEENVSPALRRFVDSMRAHPVFVLDHAWDIVARNHAAIAVFKADQLLSTPESGEDRHNFLEHIFLDETLRANCIDWDHLAGDIVAMYRFHFATYTADSRSIAVIENLLARSALFASHWEKHLVHPHPRGARAYRHPSAGILTFEPTVYSVIESTGLRLLVYSPLDVQTTTRVEELLVADLAGSAVCAVGKS